MILKNLKENAYERVTLKAILKHYRTLRFSLAKVLMKP